MIRADAASNARTILDSSVQEQPFGEVSAISANAARKSSNRVPSSSFCSRPKGGKTSSCSIGCDSADRPDFTCKAKWGLWVSVRRRVICTEELGPVELGPVEFFFD